jgi:hypothetical protein
VGPRPLLDGWLGRDRFTIVTVGAWRLASLCCGIALLAPIMNVGRRPYRLSRLAERLEAVRDMAVIPDALPTYLRWFQAMVVATIVSGLALPPRFRRLHPLASLPALVLAILVYRGATQSDWTDPTRQFVIAVVALVVTVLAALQPIPSADRPLPPTW